MLSEPASLLTIVLCFFFRPSLIADSKFVPGPKELLPSTRIVKLFRELSMLVCALCVCSGFIKV